MPCDGSYMDPNAIEISLSRVYAMEYELDGGGFNREWWRGFHPSVYCKGPTRAQLDKAVARLCERLRAIDVGAFSLELQMWWRDHQAADRKRLEREQKAIKDNEARKEALAKLSPYERELLGV